MRRYLAIDIGASSGRHIVGWKENDKLCTEEVYRFHNGVRDENGHLVWNIEALLQEVKKGIETAQKIYKDIYSLAIDTWGVDYVLLKGGNEVFPIYAYRDHRTEAVIDEVHSKIAFSKLYQKTGCQFQPFNTIYQLYADKMAGRLENVTDFLMIPEYLISRLCGQKVREYTNATTTGMVNAETGEYDQEIIEILGFPKHLFPEMTKPGHIVGDYNGIKCVLCATHDTASAVEGIQMEGNELYISSGTWSLLGVKTSKPITDQASREANYSNEGGVGYNRYQKNIMGMWLINELRRELCPDTSFSDIVRKAQNSYCRVIVDANAPEFLSPQSMKAAFDEKTGNALHTISDYFSCAYRSLAASYNEAIIQLEKNTGRIYKRLYIVGGGAKNEFLNRLTEEAAGKQVVALPIEATVLGNLKIQMEAE